MIVSSIIPPWGEVINESFAFEGSNDFKSTTVKPSKNLSLSGPCNLLTNTNKTNHTNQIKIFWIEIIPDDLHVGNIKEGSSSSTVQVRVNDRITVLQWHIPTFCYLKKFWIKKINYLLCWKQTCEWNHLSTKFDVEIIQCGFFQLFKKKQK